MERITSLQYYYNLVLSEIEKEKTESSRKYGFGYSVETYFKFLMINKDDAENRPELKKLRETVEEFVEIIEINEGKEGSVAYRLRDGEKLEKNGIETDIKKAATLFKRSQDLLIIHGHNALVSLITRFEEFVSNVLYTLYGRYPEKYLNDRQIAFHEIINLGIEEIKDAVIRKEIDAKMREDYTAWLKLLSQHRINLEKCQNYVNELREIYSRRNVIVHNSGKVNEIYMKNNKNSKYEMDTLLTVDLDYLSNAILVIKAIMFSIAIEAIRVADEDDREKEAASLFENAYEELQNEEYELSKTIFMELEECKYADANIQMMSKINCWIARDRLGEFEKIEQEIQNYDMRAMAEVFSFAKLILLREYDMATGLLERLFEKKEIITNEINSWPLLKLYRESPQFSQFRQRHKDEFDMITVEVKDPENASYETTNENEDSIGETP